MVLGIQCKTNMGFQISFDKVLLLACMGSPAIRFVIIDFDVSDSFEAILLLNESNWVDPSEKNPENVEASIVGSHFNI
ncbi:hypothetical protein OSTOST_08763, partial [Ostertagia ostertagi]